MTLLTISQMGVTSESVGACQTKPDMPMLMQALKCCTTNHTGLPPATMSMHSKPSESNTDSHIQNKPLQQMKMLLVEDSSLLRDVLLETIQHINNVTVTGTAATQQHAISQLDNMPFDIVLLDIELAQGNGFEVIKHIQKQNYPFKPPVLMMLTNHAHTYYRSLATDLGVHYFFDKSMDFERAMESIEIEAEKFAKNLN